MSEYPLNLEEIVLWLQSTEAAANRYGITLAELRQNREYTHSACADYDSLERTGQICVWATGLFDFTVLRNADGGQVFFQHEEVSSLSAPSLEVALGAFLQALCS